MSCHCWPRMACQVGWKKQGSKCGKYLCFVWKSCLLPRAWRILSSGGGTRPVHLLSVALVSPGKERDQFGFALGKGKSLICWKHSYQNNRFKIKSENRNSVGKIKLQWTVLSPGWRPYKEAFFPPPSLLSYHSWLTAGKTELPMWVLAALWRLQGRFLFKSLFISCLLSDNAAMLWHSPHCNH